MGAALNIQFSYNQTLLHYSTCMYVHVYMYVCMCVCSMCECSMRVCIYVYKALLIGRHREVELVGITTTLPMVYMTRYVDDLYIQCLYIPAHSCSVWRTVMQLSSLWS